MRDQTESETSKEGPHELEDIELQLLLEGIYLRYGHDFRDYSRASLFRRVRAIKDKLRLKTFSQLQELFLHYPQVFHDQLPDFTVTTSEMFRDPHFYVAFREQVVPLLRTYPTVKIWHAGCSTGEEVYSMAILLREEGLEKKCTLYATDINNHVLKVAREGIYHSRQVQLYTKNYQAAGGKQSFSDYYTAMYDRAQLDKTLRDSIVFSDHNLATDDVFSEFQVILCRNVMIYFNQTLQNRALKLFANSLCHKGILCMGTKESLKYLKNSFYFREFDKKEKIYQKWPSVDAHLPSP